MRLGDWGCLTAMAKHPSGSVRASLYLSVGLLAGLILTFNLDRLSATALPQHMLALDRAERSLAAYAEQPPQNTEWAPVSLPDSAPIEPTTETQHAWYRVRFEVPDSAPTLWGLMLKRPFAATKIWINGVLLADSGVTRSPLPEYRHELRYNLSSGLLREGQNTLIILTRARVHSAGLATVWLGDAGKMAAYKADRNRIEKRWPRLAVQVISLLALILFGFFMVRRQDTAFAWFAGALACWAAHTSLDIRNTPLDLAPWLVRPLILIALVWFVVFGLYFVLRLQRHRAPSLERGAVIFAVVASVIATLVSALADASAYRLVTLVLVVPGVLVLGGLISWRLWQAVRAQGATRESGWLLGLASALLVIGIRDWLLDTRLLGDWQSVRYLPFAAPAVFLVFGALLLRRYAAALASAETLNRDLEVKVAQKTVDIERSWRQIAEIDRERARFEERDRLMRDMHDGVGGHLVQALALAERAESDSRVREAIQTALDDLRLLIDASDVQSERLNDSLARLRERLCRRLKALGIELRWDFTEMPDLPRLTPERTIQVLRVLSELIANVLKHAQASYVALDCKCITDPRSGEPAQILLDVSDDGVGFDQQQAEHGRGLSNLRRRATLLGGALNIDSRVGAGTRVRLRLPVLPEEG